MKILSQHSKYMFYCFFALGQWICLMLKFYIFQLKQSIEVLLRLLNHFSFGFHKIQRVKKKQNNLFFKFRQHPSR